MEYCLSAGEIRQSNILHRYIVICRKYGKIYDINQTDNRIYNYLIWITLLEPETQGHFEAYNDSQQTPSGWKWSLYLVGLVVKQDCSNNESLSVLDLSQFAQGWLEHLYRSSFPF